MLETDSFSLSVFPWCWGLRRAADDFRSRADNSRSAADNFGSTAENYRLGEDNFKRVVLLKLSVDHPRSLLPGFDKTVIGRWTFTQKFYY